jgi:hypothetical protein
MSLIQVEESEDEGMVPYGFRPELGDCADSATAKNVNQNQYATEWSFNVAGLVIKHAP